MSRHHSSPDPARSHVYRRAGSITVNARTGAVTCHDWREEDWSRFYDEHGRPLPSHPLAPLVDLLLALAERAEPPYSEPPAPLPAPRSRRKEARLRRGVRRDLDQTGADPSP